MSLSGPPVIPTALQTYDSYATDPRYQRYYTYGWTAFAGACVLAAVPYLVRAVRSGYWRAGYAVAEYAAPPLQTTTTMAEAEVPAPTPAQPRRYSTHSRARMFLAAVAQSAFQGSIPIPTVTWARVLKQGGTQLADCCRKGYIGLTVGQMLVVAVYAAGVVVCDLQGADLRYNANRPGFLALAQLIPVILLSTKNNPLGLLLGLGYEKLNWAHRWSGRLLWLSTTLHGALWIDQYWKNGQLGVLASSANKYGIAAYALLCALAVFSVRPARRRFYEVFYALHVASFVGFMITVCYHTSYSRPWVWPCVALYALDLALRLGRYRFKDALLVPLDETMTMIHIPDADYGWLPTQHVHLRLLTSGTRMWESHPFTITNAPHSRHTSGATILGSAEGESGGVLPPRGLTLYVKVSGDWTREVNRLARQGGEGLPARSSDSDDAEDADEKDAMISPPPPPGGPLANVKVIISGPYGGLKLDMASYQSVLLIAGGSGVTFMLGCIEECLVRKAEAKRRRQCAGHNVNDDDGLVGPSKVECVWVVRDMSTIESMSATLTYLHTLATSTNALQLNYHLYLTSPPRPLPAGPPASLPATTTLSPYRPAISQLVRESLPPPTLPELEEGRGKKTCCSLGGMAVVACGPEGIVTESRNAVASLGVGDRVRCGGVDFHGECYAL